MKAAIQIYVRELAALKAGQGEPVVWRVFNTAQSCWEYGDEDELAQMPYTLQPPKKLYTSAPTIPEGYVLVPVDVLARASESLGSFCSDEGWGQEDMDNMDNLDAYLAAAPKGNLPSHRTSSGLPGIP